MFFRFRLVFLVATEFYFFYFIYDKAFKPLKLFNQFKMQYVVTAFIKF